MLLFKVYVDLVLRVGLGWSLLFFSFDINPASYDLKR